MIKTEKYRQNCRRTLLLGSLALIALVGCRHQLEKDKAEDFIRASDFMKEPSGEDFVLYENSVLPASELLQSHPEVRPFIEQGFAEIRPNTVIGPLSVGAKIALTTKGKMAADANWKRTTRASGEEAWTIPVARRNFVIIDELSQKGDSADCKFSWQLVPTEMGQGLGRKTVAGKAHAHFDYKDDAWRLVEVNAE